MLFTRVSYNETDLHYLVCVTMNKSCLLFFAFFFSVTASSQKAEENLEKLYKQYPQEKVVLSLTKNDYLAGETIFFKGYVFSGYDLTTISTNLYVELYDAEKKLVDKILLPLYKGASEGSFVLPASTAEGVYYIRAYTQWMLNFDERFSFLKAIKIYNPYSSKRLQRKPVSWSASVFPESGILLANVSNKVAVRLTATGSPPQQWTAALIEKNEGRKLLQVSSFNPQIALLEFTPAAGKTYSVRITDNAGNTKEVELPKVQERGIVLQTSTQGDKILYNVFFAGDINSTGYKMIGTLHDQLFFKGLVKQSSSHISGKIDKKNFPSGVLRLALFDDKENVLAERLCFIAPLHLKIDTPRLTFDSLSFAAKGLNQVQINQDTVTWYTYAMQVQDAAYPKPDNFLSEFFLSSDFVSEIENPTWYFDEIDAVKATALDALLITESWTRYSWKDVVAGSFPTIRFSPDQYLSYKGTVSRKKRMENIKDLNLLFKTRDSSMQIVQVHLDSAGSFYLQNAAFIDTVTVYYQLNSKRYAAREVDVQFESLNKFHPLSRSFSLPHTAYELVSRSGGDSIPAHIAWSAESYNNVRLVNEKSKMMQEVVIRYNRKSLKQQLDEKLSRGMFSGGDATVFDFVNEEQTSATGYNNILEWLSGRVAGLSVSNVNGVLTPSMRGGTPAIYVDEMYTEPDFLNSLSISDIAMVKVFRGVFMGTMAASEGAIAIYTKRGDMGNRFSLPVLPNNILAGYKKQSSFFLPDYTNPLYRTFPDKREILFYSNMLFPDKNFNTTIRFNNNDAAKSFRLIVTGFTNDGRPVFLDQIIH